jgi:hypothetical protein
MNYINLNPPEKSVSSTDKYSIFRWSSDLHNNANTITSSPIVDWKVALKNYSENAGVCDGNCVAEKEKEKDSKKQETHREPQKDLRGYRDSGKDLRGGTGGTGGPQRNVGSNSVTHVDKNLSIGPTNIGPTVINTPSKSSGGSGSSGMRIYRKIIETGS